MNHIEQYYDVTTETKVYGEADDLEDTAASGDGLVRIPINDAKMELILGPRWFVKTEDLALLKKWPFEVTGSLLHRSGKDVLLAREIFCNGHKIFLRDPFGQPLWRTWARSSR